MKTKQFELLFTILIFSIFNLLKAETQLDQKSLRQSLKDLQTVTRPNKCLTCIGDSKLSHEKSNQLTDLNNDKFELSVLTIEEANSLVIEFLSNKSIPFDYALDGCFARAHKMALLMDEKGIISGKSFVMGQLYAKTKYGNAHWRYHVAPVVLVKLDGKVLPYIIDPALFDHAVPFEEWRNLITGVRNNAPKVIKGMYVQYYTKRFNYDPTSAKEKLTDYRPEDIVDTETTLVRYQQIKEKLDSEAKSSN